MSHHDNVPAHYPPLELETDLSSVTVRELSEQDDEAYFTLIHNNSDRLKEGGLDYGRIYRDIGAVAARRIGDEMNIMGIWRNGELAGGVEMTKIEDGETSLNVWVSQEHEGRRIGATAANAVVRHNMANGISVTAEALQSNTASRAMLQKLKFIPADDAHGMKFMRKATKYETERAQSNQARSLPRKSDSSTSL